MKGKKLISKWFFVLLVSIILLAGCSSSETGDTDASSEEQITLDIFQFKTGHDDDFDKLIGEFEKEYPNVTVGIQTVGGGNDYGGTLTTKFSSGDEPDIFNVLGPTEIERYRENLADLSDTEAAKAALEGTLTGVTDGEEIIGLPYNSEGYGFIYNKLIFEEAGIDPSQIGTFEDFEAAVETLDSQKEELGIEAVFAFAGKETWTFGQHLSNAFLAPEFNHDVIEAYNADTVSFEKGDELKRMIDLQNKYSVQPVLSLDLTMQVEENFSFEKVAMIKQGNWSYTDIDAVNPEIAEHVGILPIPVEGLEGKVPVGVPMNWAVNKNSEEEVIQAAKDFLDFMYTSDTGKEIVVKDFDFIPAYEGYDISDITSPLSQDIYSYMEEGNTIGWVFMGSPLGWNDDVLGVNIQKYLADEFTWEEVEADSIAKWEEARQ